MFPIYHPISFFLRHKWFVLVSGTIWNYFRSNNVMKNNSMYVFLFCKKSFVQSCGPHNNTLWTHLHSLNLLICTLLEIKSKNCFDVQLMMLSKQWWIHCLWTPSCNYNKDTNSRRSSCITWPACESRRSKVKPVLAVQTCVPQLLWKPRQVDHELEACLDYTVSSSPTWASWWKTKS